jgi:hypothetical protein
MRVRGEGSIRQRRRANGTVFWEARAVKNGHRVSFHDDAESAAMAKSRQARADAERGRRQTKESLTVEAHLRQWLEGTVGQSVRARTYKSYREHCENHIIPAVGRVRLVQLTPGHVQHMLSAMLQAGLSVTTVKHTRSTLSAALRGAQLGHGLPRNVVSLAKVAKTDQPGLHA